MKVRARREKVNRPRGEPLRMRPPGTRIPVGWKEWISLPTLGIPLACAKIDTGAKTSALHVAAIAPVPGRPDALDITLEGESRPVRVRVHRWITVKNSGGEEERRPVIGATIRLGDYRLKVRLGLTFRGGMRCPVLLGRAALRGLFLVVPEAVHLLGRPRRLRRGPAIPEPPLGLAALG
jgi:hypothetical protein